MYRVNETPNPDVFNLHMHIFKIIVIRQSISINYGSAPVRVYVIDCLEIKNHD